MAKENKKSDKKASNIFHNIMAASVKGNPKPKSKRTELKFKIGDEVLKTDGQKGNYRIIATKNNKKNISIPEGFDYVISLNGSVKHEYVFEDDIYLI